MSEELVPAGSYAVTNTRECKHGQLARSCEICDLESQLSKATALLKKVHDDLLLRAEKRGEERVVNLSQSAWLALSAFVAAAEGKG